MGGELLLLYVKNEQWLLGEQKGQVQLEAPLCGACGIYWVAIDSAKDIHGCLPSFITLSLLNINLRESA